MIRTRTVANTPTRLFSRAIVGAGMGGLTAASTLRRFCFDLQVYEQATGFAHRRRHFLERRHGVHGGLQAFYFDPSEAGFLQIKSQQRSRDGASSSAAVHPRGSPDPARLRTRPSRTPRLRERSGLRRGEAIRNR